MPDSETDFRIGGTLLSEMMPTNPQVSLRALVVDDNPVNRKVAELFLLHLGLMVGHASSGLEALNALADANYDVILMDVHMPEMDGLEATKQFRLWRPGTPGSSVHWNAVSSGDLGCASIRRAAPISLRAWRGQGRCTLHSKARPGIPLRRGG
jgi:CheY-like chemotaxis protein